MYKIELYHGGEQPDETRFARTLKEAYKIALSAEASDIIELTKKVTKK